jgi:hypothetical protein
MNGPFWSPEPPADRGRQLVQRLAGAGATVIAHSRDAQGPTGCAIKGNAFAGVPSVVSFLRVPSPDVGDPHSTGRFSIRYPMCPPPVTSNCHSSRLVPRRLAVERRPRSLSWRSVDGIGRGVARMVSKARRRFAGATRASSSQPLALSVLSKRISSSSPTPRLRRCSAGVAEIHQRPVTTDHRTGRATPGNTVDGVREPDH